MDEQDLRDRTAPFRKLVFDSIHELKSPLVSIRGFTEILLERTADRLTEAELGYLGRILKNVDRLSDQLEAIRRKGVTMADDASEPASKK